MKNVVGAFIQMKALVGDFSVIVKLQTSVFRDKSAELTTVPGISADSPRASLGVCHLGVTCAAVLLLSRCVTCHELCNV